MTNYYKQFDKFKESENIKDGISVEEFEKKMILYYGFGGRNRSLKRWIENFRHVGLIKIIKVKGTSNDWIVLFNMEKI